MRPTIVGIKHGVPIATNNGESRTHLGDLQGSLSWFHW